MYSILFFKYDIYICIFNNCFIHFYVFYLIKSYHFVLFFAELLGWWTAGARPSPSGLSIVFV